MLESYQREIAKKRQSARIFWSIVFVCSFFFYFFFQGYYLDIRVGLHRILSEANNTPNTLSGEFIRSFGIINVRTTQIDTALTLGSGSYSNNEKRMSDYGDYTMSIGKPGYLTGGIGFKIDREKPFFIENITLIPTPKYRKLLTHTGTIILAENKWIIPSGSGSLFATGNTMTGYILSGNITPIGGLYVRTASGALMQWEKEKPQKVSKVIEDFIKTCPSLEWKYEVFFCPSTKSLLTPSEQYLTGILDIQNHLVEQSGSIHLISDGILTEKWSSTGGIDHTYVIGNTLYRAHSGTLSGNKKTDIIQTPLDTIIHGKLLHEDLVIIGTKEHLPYLLIRHRGDPLDREKLIPLPTHLTYENVELRDPLGNLTIKTPQALLLIYRGSREIHWLVEGNILSYTETGTLYQNSGAIWSGDWSEEL